MNNVITSEKNFAIRFSRAVTIHMQMKSVFIAMYKRLAVRILEIFYHTCV